MKITVRRQVLVFGIAGGTGFFIEASIIQFAVTYLESGANTPRLLSFPLAFIWTWYINRTYGFQVSAKPNIDEFLRFLQSNILAQLVNIGLYFALTRKSEFFSDLPVLALILATSISMVVSFTLYRLYAFSGRASGE